MNWKEHAIKRLHESLEPVPSELNDVDWKVSLSDKTDRLAQHISAFANYPFGGVLAFGINDEGIPFSLTKPQIDDIVKRLSNIGNNNLSQHIQIDHTVEVFGGENILLVSIPEMSDKPVYPRGKDIYESYYRSGGQTLKMSAKQVHAMISRSRGYNFEKCLAKEKLTKNEVLGLLDYQALYRLLDKDLPKSTDTVIAKLSEMDFCKDNDADLWDITNLGAILFAKSLSAFETLQGREVIVRKYDGPNNRGAALFEQKGVYGYAVGFEGLIDFIMRNTSTESIDVSRTMIPTYPRVAIREFVANALIHQDFAIDGSPISIEIFSNRLVITNPGAPLNDVARLLDLPPHSRNEDLAQKMLLLNFCERRGSGIDRAVEAIERMLLPPVKIQSHNDYTRVTLYPQKPFSEMTKEERVMACYQHACLLHEDNQPINNQSLRERFGLNKNQNSIASRILADTIERKLIKPMNEETTSKKFTSYIPYYA